MSAGRRDVESPEQCLVDLLLDRNRPVWGSRSAGFWDSVIALAQRHRVHPFLRKTLAGMSQAIPPEVIRTLNRETAAWQAKRKVLLSAMIEVAEVAESAGVELIVLKGPNLAERLYAVPEFRMFRDLDLLVRPEQWSGMWEALGRAGYEMTSGPYTGLDPDDLLAWRLPVTISPRGIAGITIDLHTSPLSRLEAFHFPSESLWERSRVWKHGLKELGDKDFLLLLFLHAMKHGYFDLLCFLDLERASRDERLCRLFGGVLEEASRHGFSACIWTALALGRDLLGVEWPDAGPQRARLRARFVARLTRKPALEARPWISERAQLLAVHPLLVDGWRKRLRCLRLLLLRPPSTIGPTPFKTGFRQNPWASTVRQIRNLRKRLAGG